MVSGFPCLLCGFAEHRTRSPCPPGAKPAQLQGSSYGFLHRLLPFAPSNIASSRNRSGTSRLSVLSMLTTCHTWTKLRIWNNLLRNVRVVISTHQILCDAISHAFVRLYRLTILIFDEGTDLSDNTRAHFEPDHAIDAQRAGGD